MSAPTLPSQAASGSNIAPPQAFTETMRTVADHTAVVPRIILRSPPLTTMARQMLVTVDDEV
jgi:hypothetical protein